MNRTIPLLSIICFVFLQLLCTLAAAQSGAKNSLAVIIGLNNLHIVDEHATPVIFRGTGIIPSAGYSHESRSGYHSIEGSFYLMNLSAASDNYKTEIGTGHLRYSYFHQLSDGSSAGKRTLFAAGASVSSLFMKYDYLIRQSTDLIKGSESWYGCHSFDLAAQIRYGWGKGNQVGIVFYLPLVSNVSRPAYSTSGDYNYEKNDWDVKVFGKTMIIPGNLMLSNTISFQRPLTKDLEFTVLYKFCFTQCRTPDLVRWYANSFSAGLVYNLNSRKNGED